VATSYNGLTDQVRKVLDDLDPLVREQYLDFAKCRRFRQTLLCREGVAIERGVGPEKIAGFRFLSRRRGLAGEGASASPPPDEELIPRAILDALDAAAPEALSVDDLVKRIPGSERGNLLRLCLAGAQAGAIQLHTRVPALSTTLAVRPLASAVARAQVVGSESVTNLRHGTVDLDDELVRKILPLLDGTRDTAAVASALGRPPEEIEPRLRQLGRLALLV
jgi:methyltransferase-like protein